MSLMDYVMEARKNATTINVTGRVRDDDEDDASQNVPEDPDVTPEENEDDPEEDRPEAGTGTDYSQGAPEDEDDAGEDEPAEDEDAPADRGTGVDYSQGAPEDTDDDTPDDDAANDTNANPEPANDAGGNATQDTPAPEPAGNDAGGGDAPAAINVTGATNDNDAGGGNAPGTGNDFGEPPSAEGGDEGDQGNDAPEAGAQDQPNAGGNDPNQEGGEDQGAEGEGGEDNPEGEGEEDDTGDMDNMDNANSMSDASDNGENAEELTNNDKKNNIIILRNSYVELYNQVTSFLQKLENVAKDSLLAAVTFNQVKDNMTRLKDLLVNYISLYYDTNEYEINLFNFNYIIEIIRVNVEMINKMKKGREKLKLAS
jgi:hypothetical protein